MSMNVVSHFKMARNLFIGYRLVCLCVVVFPAFYTHTTSAQLFSKALLVWPPSLCKVPGAFCRGPIIHRFTIKTLAAMHEDGTIVEKGECTKLRQQDLKPLTEEMLTRERILDDMKKYWPNLEEPENTQLDIENWENQRKEKAGCFEKANRPLYYFKRALDVIKEHDLLEILRGDGDDRDSELKISPKDDDTYPASVIASVINGHLKAKPEIHCNVNADLIRQFCGLAICLDRFNIPIDCPQQFHKCSDDPEIPNEETLKLLFPTAGSVKKD